MTEDQASEFLSTLDEGIPEPQSTENLDGIADQVFDLMPTIWASDTDTYALGGLIGGSGDPVTASCALDEKLQEVMRQAPSMTDIDLSMWLRSTFSVRDKLPTWEPLLYRAYEVITERYGEARALFKLRGLQPPRQQQATYHNSRK
jgi:hypothetical protein